MSILLSSFLGLQNRLLAYSGGSGSSSDPYQIATTQDLLELSGKPEDYGKAFVQTAAIDLSGQTYASALIAADTDTETDGFQGVSFSGTFDGAGYAINGLTISGNSYLGLFGEISGVIKRITLNNVAITAAGAAVRVGGLCGFNSGGTISDAHVSGSVAGAQAATGGLCGNNGGIITGCTASVELDAGTHHSGGLCGYNNGDILYSGTEGTVSGGGSATRIGGLCGWNDLAGTIKECFSGSAVNNAMASLGGLCGVNYGLISDCFASGAVSSGENHAGGLCGYNDSRAEIERCYSVGAVSGASTVGGLCGTNLSRNVKVSFWDMESSGVVSNGRAGIGKTTAQMRSQSTFTSAGWNFSSVWVMDGYPVLRNAVDVPDKQADLITIEGEDEVEEGGETAFTCTAHYFDETSADLTEEVSWSVDQESYCSISNGVVTAGNVSEDVTVYIMAAYQGLLVSNALKIIYMPAPQPPYNESFEEDLGAWFSSQGYEAEWYRSEGATPSANTGPDAAADGIWYLCVDASAHSPSQSAAIEAEFNFTDCASPMLSFDYHMHGSQMGSLDVDVFDGSLWHNSLWHKEGEQQLSSDQEWSIAEVDLAAFAGMNHVLIRFRGTTGGAGPLSDIAIDNISLNNMSEGGVYSGGAGTRSSPFKIATRQDLLDLAENDIDYDKHFKVIANIDMAEDVFGEALIAPDKYFAEFTGSFDGDGYIISNLYFNADEMMVESLGLFGNISSARLRNVNLENVFITNVVDSANIGALCGFSLNSTVSNCHASVTVHAGESTAIGGLIGRVDDQEYEFAFEDDVEATNLISSCSISGSIYAGENSFQVGGVAGYCGELLYDCESSVVIEALNTTEVGGVAGVVGAYAVMKNCHAAGRISGVESRTIGGLCGVNRGDIISGGAEVALTFAGSYFLEQYGGLCGLNESNASIWGSYATGDLLIDGEPFDVGGFCGSNNGTIIESYAVGSVFISVSAYAVGGFCGGNVGALSSCYARGAVKVGDRANAFGGFCGDNYGAVDDCYAAGQLIYGINPVKYGGFCGNNPGTVTSSFWDVELSGIATSPAGTGTNSTAMRSENTFTDAGWDFAGESLNGTDSIWYMRGYPALSNVEFKAPAQRLPYSEGFEFGQGIWDDSAEADFSWTRNSGATPSPGTGPSQASEGDFYLYAEATGNFPAKTAAIEARFKLINTCQPVLNFDYHMFGGHTGSLHVDIFDGVEWSDSVWFRDGEQHLDYAYGWSTAAIDLAEFTGVSQIIVRIRAITGISYLSDIAVDNIHFSGNDGYSGGSGSQEDPYLIAERDDLLALMCNTSHYDKHFRQTEHIDLIGEVFTQAVIADNSSDDRFTGVYDGGGKTISNLLFTAGTSTSGCLGLFGHISGAELRNISLYGVTGSGDSLRGVGALCALASGSVISNCSASGVAFDISNSSFIGGLIGVLAGPEYEFYADANSSNLCSVVDCSVNGRIQAVDSVGIGGLTAYGGGVISNTHSEVEIAGTGYCGEVGGLTGVISPYGAVFHSYTTGLVSMVNGDLIGGLCGTNNGLIKASYAQAGVLCSNDSQFIGGLCGANAGAIESCFSVGDVQCAGAASALGGFSGMNLGDINNCYSVGALSAGAGSDSIGGFNGINSGDISGCFWDVPRSGLNVSAGGSAQTTTMMLQYSLYDGAGWDFVGEAVNGSEDIWKMDEYPVIDALPFDCVFSPLNFSNIIMVVMDGLTTVNESQSSQFSMMVYYADQTEADITDVTVWTVNPQEYAGFDSGLLITDMVPSNMTVEVVGVYGHLAVTQLVTIVDISRPPYAESFESDFGLWNQSADNDFNWVRHQGATISSRTGPSGASDGSWYLLAVAADNLPVKSAMVEAEFNLAGADNPMLSFDYHMYGSYMGELHVDVSTGGLWITDCWFRSGEQHSSESSPWSTAEIDLSDFAGIPQVWIRFRAVTGSDYMGDIAVDNIRLTDNEQIEVRSVNLQGVDQVTEGESVELKGFAFYSDGSSEDITTNAAWSVDHRYATIINGVLTAKPVASNVNITVTMDYAGFSDSKTVTILNVSLPAPPIAESFEKGMGIWESATGFDFEWQRNSGQTPTVNTGPAEAADGSYYLYIEAKGNSPYKEAAIEAEFDLADTLQPLLEFDYHMYGAEIGSLSVDVLDGTAWNYNLWALSGEQHLSSTSAWKTASVDLSGFAGSVVTIRFRASTGQNWLGDIALDNLRLTDAGVRSYSEWLADEGVPADKLGENDAPAGDNIPNLLKYACGLSAMTIYSTADYMNIASNLPARQFGIIYYKSKRAKDVVLEPIWSDSLPGTGNWSAQGLSINKISEDQEREMWRAVLTDEERGFFKLQAK